MVVELVLSARVGDIGDVEVCTCRPTLQREVTDDSDTANY
jgi:hypothetical protein